MALLTVPDCPTFWIKYPAREGRHRKQRETQTKMNLSTNRRKLGAIGLIVAGILAFSIPFLLHSPTSANTTTNPKGPGTSSTNNGNTGTSGTSTNPTGSNSNPSGSKSGSRDDSGENSSTGACDNDNDTKTGDPAHGHAYAYGQSKNGNHKDVVSMVVEKLHKLGSGMGTHHQTHSTRTDNHLDAQNGQGDSDSQSSHGAACRDDEEVEKD